LYSVHLVEVGTLRFRPVLHFSYFWFTCALVFSVAMLSVNAMHYVISSLLSLVSRQNSIMVSFLSKI
jgi:hypothetical protein